MQQIPTTRLIDSESDLAWLNGIMRTGISVRLALDDPEPPQPVQDFLAALHISVEQGFPLMIHEILTSALLGWLRLRFGGTLEAHLAHLPAIDGPLLVLAPHGQARALFAHILAGDDEQEQRPNFLAPGTCAPGARVPNRRDRRGRASRLRRHAS